MKKTRHPYLKTGKCKRITFNQSVRHFICKRDKFTCQLCGKNLNNKPTERILDHKVPLSKYGSNNLSNIWLLCFECDKEKKNKIIEEAADSYVSNRIQEIKDALKL